MNTLHRKIHKHLKLQHHKHTGKVLHHEHTSYRGLAVVLMLAGVVLVGATIVQRAAADSLLSVYGTLEVPAPSTGVSITLPNDNATLTSADTLVAGSCPIASPQVTVVLMVDGTAAGSAICDSSNDFSMPLRLTPGAHTLVAQAYTITGQQTPDSQAVHAAYQPKAAESSSVSGLSLASAAPFAVLGADHTATWNGTVSDGTAPYHFIIDWGDGDREAHTVASASQRFSHHYDTLHSYNITLAATDTTGRSTQQQYASAAYTTLPARNAAFVANISNGSTFGTRTMAGLYGLYLTVISVCGIVWLEAKHAARQHVTT